MRRPFISILLPIRNESAFIQQGLCAILAKDYPVDHMEIIIAEDFSADDTRHPN